MKKFNCLFLIIIVSYLLNFGTCKKIMEVYVESDLKPVDGFNKTDIQAVAILNFDASAIKEKGVDRISLRDSIAYDIIRNLYEQKKIRVIQGQAVQSVQEREMLQSTIGDYEAASSTIERIVTYKYNPYQKVDAILTGKVLDYVVNDEDHPGYNYIEVLIELIDSVDGTLYWVSKIRGNYKDVVFTITHTISEKTYTEPTIAISNPSMTLPSANLEPNSSKLPPPPPTPNAGQ